MQLEVGKRVVITGVLPRLVRGAEVVEHAQGATITGKIVSLKTEVGKDVGVELDRPADGWAYHDAHECDGACVRGRGWFVTEAQVVEVL